MPQSRQLTQFRISNASLFMTAARAYSEANCSQVIRSRALDQDEELERMNLLLG